MPAPLGRHEPVPFGVERPAGPLRIIVPSAERAHHGESGQSELADAGLGAAGDHGVSHAVANSLQRLADGVVGRGAGRGRRGVVARARPHTGSRWRPPCWAAPWGKRTATSAFRPGRPGSGSFPPGWGSLRCRCPAAHAYAIRVFLRHVQAGVRYGLQRGRHRHLREPGHAAGLPPVDVVGGVKIVGLARDPAGIVGRVAQGHGPMPDTPATRLSQNLFGAQAQRGNRPQAGYHHAPPSVFGVHHGDNCSSRVPVSVNRAGAGRDTSPALCPGRPPAPRRPRTANR